MKNLVYLFLLVVALVSCDSAISDTKQIASTITEVSNAEENDSTYRIENGKLYGTAEGVRAVYTKSEDGTIYARAGYNNPVYECKCKKGTGECKITTGSGSGELYCCCDDKCKSSDDNMIGQNTNSCTWSRTSKSMIPKNVDIQLRSLELAWEEFKPETEFNEEGYRMIEPGVLEFKSENMFKMEEDESGNTYARIISSGTEVQCRCTCESGDCVTEIATMTTIRCATKRGTEFCIAKDNGIPCRGCVWFRLAKK